MCRCLPTFAKNNDELAKEAFIYAYSMDEAYKFFNETAIKGSGAVKLLPDYSATYSAHPIINNDTLYLQGWLDVSAELVIISVPDMDKGRYIEKALGMP